MTTKGKKMKKNKTKIALNINEIKKKSEMVGCCAGAKKNFELGQEIAESGMEKLWDIANTAENDEEAVYDLLNLFAGFLSLSMIYVSTFKDKEDSKRLVGFAMSTFEKALEEEK
mgnify:FL=1|tara:strand:- start:263 stop:604 length:342 start_codon:yes stop_codon:yes gene_type:complete